MEISKENKFVDFMKKYWAYTVLGLVVFAVALTFTLAFSLSPKNVPVSNNQLSFRLPMQNALVVKDFSNTELQKNETLNQWEAHLAVDLTSDASDVFAVADGTVASVEYSYLDGYTVTINHADGFVSTYSSLSESEIASVGAKVNAGDKIGVAERTASGELELGSHLHFSLMKDNSFVNPNDYLDLQIK